MAEPQPTDPVNLAIGRALVGLTVGYEPVPGSPLAGDYQVTRAWVRANGDVVVDLFRPARASNDTDRTAAAVVTTVTVVPECLDEYARRLPGEWAKVDPDAQPATDTKERP